MNPFDRYRAHRAGRRANEESRILAMLAYCGELSAYPLSQLTGMRTGKVVAVLARLEAQDRVTSRWVGPTPPRRRLYSVAR